MKTEMNSRFRFRVWDKVAQGYNNREYYINMTGGLSRLLPMARANEAGSLSLDNFVIEQCTGRQDINGKLIYEGDILKIKYGRHKVHYTATASIHWNGLGFILKEKDGSCIIRFDLPAVIEVIGNIHENPELMEG